jgi:hypothetical protein
LDDALETCLNHRLVSGEFTALVGTKLSFLRGGWNLEVQRIVQTEEDEDPRTFLKVDYPRGNTVSCDLVW